MIEFRPLRAGVTAAGLAVLALAATGCPADAVTGINGRVRQAPCGRPVVEGEPVCEDLPVRAGVVVTRADGTVAGRAETDRQGRYAVSLGREAAVGTYTVTIDTGTPKPMWPNCPVKTIEVTAGSNRLDFLCGSGMR
jgi:hypothetical protein